jgi:short-subunit dehydrogenase
MTRTYKAALVTGASSGIGAAFARALPRQTALLLTGRDPDALEAVRQAVAADGRRVQCVVADLATRAGVEEVASAAEAFGIDLLIANAGLGPFGPFLQASEQALHDAVAVNVMATTLLARRLLARVAGARPGAWRPRRPNRGGKRGRLPARAEPGGVRSLQGVRPVAG